MDDGRHNGKVCPFLCLSRCDIQCVIWLRLFLPAFVAAACVLPHVLLHLPLHPTSTFSCSRKSAVASVLSSTLNIYKSKLSTWFFFCLPLNFNDSVTSFHSKFPMFKNSLKIEVFSVKPVISILDIQTNMEFNYPLRWEKTSQEFNKIESTSIKKPQSCCIELKTLHYSEAWQLF